MPTLTQLPRRVVRGLRRRWPLGTSAASTPSAAPEDDDWTPSPPSACSPADVERWNKEWLRYLGREFENQLRPHTAYVGKPPLPAQAIDVVDHEVGPRKLHVYVEPDALEGKKVMELGCGCGHLGKLIGRYTDSYLGVDYSTLALRIAALVSPDNCHYVHVADESGLEPWLGRIDTVVARHFWIHQNFQLAGWNLEFLARFLRPGGRLYADFFWRDPNAKHFKVFPPTHALSKQWPSATFEYTEADVKKLIAGTPFSLVRQEISVPMQRRYAILVRA